jgi:hypothetical protein
MHRPAPAPSSAASRQSTSASGGPLTLATSPSGGCISSSSPSFRPTSSSEDAPKTRHMRRSVPNWLISSGCDDPFTFSNRSAGPALDHGVVDLGDLEVGIDLRGDTNELALALEHRDPTCVRSPGGATRISLWTRARIPPPVRASSPNPRATRVPTSLHRASPGQHRGNPRAERLRTTLQSASSL